MPIVRIELLEGRSSEQKRALIRQVSEAVTASLGVRAEQVRVLLYELPADHWAIGGTTIAERNSEPPK